MSDIYLVWCIVKAQSNGDDESDCGFAKKYFLLEKIFSSLLLLRSFIPHIFPALPGGTLMLRPKPEERCTTNYGLLLRSCLIGWRNMRWTSFWSRGHS